MTAASDLTGLLSRKPIALVVEDMLVKEYLLHAWGVERKHFTTVVAGSHAVVKGVVEDLRKYGANHVFGLVDRDFGQANVARWRAASGPPAILRGDHHEAENYLLDWDALAGCDINQRMHRRSVAEVRSWAEAAADRQLYWLACRKLLRDIQAAVGDGFPEDPCLDDVKSEDDAERYILEHGWTQSLKARADQVLDRVRLHQETQAAVAEFKAARADGSWRTVFSGKEIFRWLLSRIYDVPKRAGIAEVDLAISVAKWQASNGRVPAEVCAIRDALKARVGI